MWTLFAILLYNYSSSGFVTYSMSQIRSSHCSLYSLNCLYLSTCDWIWPGTRPYRCISICRLVAVHARMWHMSATTLVASPHPLLYHSNRNSLLIWLCIHIFLLAWFCNTKLYSDLDTIWQRKLLYWFVVKGSYLYIRWVCNANGSFVLVVKGMFLYLMVVVAQTSLLIWLWKAYLYVTCVCIAGGSRGLVVNVSYLYLRCVCNTNFSIVLLEKTYCHT